ncbi:PREDICTED: trypsin-1-like [Nicrophorus vespilloides]|uniref:Trypsin-1-like n=1 Tax=Nicrophorus vespilloides TaxID=110193 RepID=A0ABM1MVR1_NICVS|nr:PREDICTED: trypsin-1-like [Nicrophorus vespilloides]
MLLVLMILFSIINNTIALSNDLFIIHNPILEDVNDNYTSHEVEVFPSKCGLRGGYYFNRIVGGQISEPGEFPWIVSLQIRVRNMSKHICGGAIINALWIISAAHCVFDLNPSEISIVAGDYNLYIQEGFEQRRQAYKIFTKNFDLTNFQNDISLIKLQKPLKLVEKRIEPICLPLPDDVFYGNGVVAGWGRWDENERATPRLNHVSLPIINKTVCDYQYKRVGFSGYLNDCQMCAGFLNGRKDACQGDSGGPLICNKDNDRYYLCGIVSWGIGCGRPNYPGIYTKVLFFKFYSLFMSNHIYFRSLASLNGYPTQL